MNTQRDNGDPELRALLDSLGLEQAARGPVQLDPIAQAKADQMLADVRAARDAELREMEARPRRLRITFRRVALASVLCIASTLAIVVVPWGGGRPALADTPPLLRFSLAKEGEYPATGGSARRVLEQLATRARSQPQRERLAVQEIELDGWLATSSPAGQARPARTAIVPVHSSIYVFSNGDRRAIDRRGKPLDQHGRLALSPNRELPFSDVITRLDHERGPEFAQDLPSDPARMLAILAPKDACGNRVGGCLLKQVSEMYNNYVIDPELAGRLWRVLRSQPTITTLGTGVDRLGRKVVALTSVGLTPSEQLIVLANPDTGAYLGSEVILIKRDRAYGIKPPAVIQFTALLSSRRVGIDSVPDDTDSKRY